MPIYKIKCTECGKEDEIFRKVSEYNDLPDCCGNKMERVICPHQVMPDIQPYISQIDGSIISSRSQHRTHLKDHGCIEIGNEKVQNKPIEPPKGLKETIGREVYRHLG